MFFSQRFFKSFDELNTYEKHVNAPYIRKAFSLQNVVSAEVSVGSTGFYELYVNGQNITKGLLAPYIANPDDVVYYDRYDVTPYLAAGETVFGLILGNGMQNCPGGRVWDFDIAKFRGAPSFAFGLTVTFADGSKKTYEADESFRCAPSPILFDDLRSGCFYDANLEQPGWCAPGFDDSAWQPVKPAERPRGDGKECEADPIAVTREIAPVAVYEGVLATDFDNRENMRLDTQFRFDVRGKKGVVYDFGVNAAGIVRLKLRGKKGQRILIQLCEHRKTNGEIANKSIGSFYPDGYCQTVLYICKGEGEETFVPSFTYMGFRFAVVHGLEPEQAVPETLTMLEAHSDLKCRADYECSDDTMNTLRDMVRRSDLANFWYFPTDCPHREKNGWTGDASVSAEHMLLNLTAENSLREWLFNIRLAQRSDGALPGIIPTGGWGFDWGNGPAWDSVCVILPYYIYRFTGDREVILENASMILRYLDYISRRRDERGLVAVGLGDWLDPFKRQNGGIASPLWVTDSATVFDISCKAAFLFSRAGLNKEADYARALAAEMRESFRRHLIDPDTMTVAGDCQTSQAFALEAGLFDDAELPAARRRLVEIIHRDHDVNACGMIGLRHIYHALIHAGEADLAYQLITSTSRSCYGYWIAHGATSLWECFPDLDVGSEGSKNHHFMGDISSLFIQEFAGLKPNPQSDDVNSCEISPHFVEKLDYAEAYYLAPKGKISVRWDRTPGGITVRICMPEGTKGSLILPDGYRMADGRKEMALEGPCDNLIVMAECTDSE